MYTLYRIKELLIAFAVALSILGTAHAQSGMPPLSVMSWNIRYDNAGDGENAWRQRKDWVAEIILREKVDVGGFQEVLARQFDDLQKRLPDFDSYGVGRDDGKQAGEMVPIFYRRDRFKLLEKGTFWLSPTPDKPGSMGWDAAITRITCWLLLEDKDTSAKFYILNAHFDHRGVEARKQSAALIVKRIREEFKAHPVIFLGDFNSTPDTTAYKTLAAKDKDERGLLQDAYVHTAAKAEGPDSTWNGFKKIVPGQRIDYIFTTAPFAVNQFRTLDDQRDGKFPSDHLPIVASVFLRSAK